MANMFGTFGDIAFLSEELGVEVDRTSLQAEQLKKLEEIEEIIDSPEKELQPINEVDVESIEATNLARSDPDFLAAIAMPTVYEYALPPIYIHLWAYLLELVGRSRDFSRLALGLPRGFGKTMLMKLFILYCILFTQRKFILVICETQNKANNILSDVIDMLNELNIISLFGDWKQGIETDRLDLKKFGFRGRNIILMGAGAESGIRGINLKNNRPDVMLFDDVQSRDNADSKTQADKLEREIIGTAMKAKSPHGCLFIYVGNMYPTNYCILRKLKDNPTWIKFICGGILHDGTSLWEELQPIEQLLQEYENDRSMGHPEIFAAEVLNDENAAANNSIDLNALPAMNHLPDDIPQGKFIIIDPSKGAINSDDVAIGYCELYDALPTLVEVENGKFSPGETIRIALKMALEHDCHLVAIEGVAYQATLGYWFNIICAQLGIIGINAVEIYPGGSSKNSRILNMFKSYSAGELFIAPACRAAVHSEILSFNPLKSNNVDNLLDVVTYMPKVVELYGAYIQNMEVIGETEYNDIPLLPAGVNSFI